MDNEINLGIQLGLDLQDADKLEKDVEKSLTKGIDNSLKKAIQNIAKEFDSKFTKEEMKYIMDSMKQSMELKNNILTTSSAMTRFGQITAQLDLSGFKGLKADLDTIETQLKSISAKAELLPSIYSKTQTRIPSKDVKTQILTESAEVKGLGEGFAFGQDYEIEKQIRNQLKEGILDNLAKSQVKVTKSILDNLDDYVSKVKLFFDESNRQLTVYSNFQIDKYTALQTVLKGVAVLEKSDGSKEFALTGKQITFTKDSVKQLNDYQKEYTDNLKNLKTIRQQLKSVEDSGNTKLINDLKEEIKLRENIGRRYTKGGTKEIPADIRKTVKDDLSNQEKILSINTRVANVEKEKQEKISNNNRLLKETVAIQEKLLSLQSKGKGETATGGILKEELVARQPKLEAVGLGIKDTGEIYFNNQQKAAKAFGVTLKEVEEIVQKYNGQINTKRANIVDDTETQNLTKLKRLYTELTDAQIKLEQFKKGKASTTTIQSQNEIVNGIQQEINSTKQSITTTYGKKQADDMLAESIRNLNQKTNELNSTTSRAKGIFANFTTEIKRTLTHVLEYGLAWQVFSTLRNALNATKQIIIEFDTAIVELQKVTDLSGESLKKFVQESFNVGVAIGRTGKEVLNASAEFARAGYEAQDALNLAGTALVFTNVADGINDVKEASSSMISILSGFKMEASEATHIIDALNEVNYLPSLLVI